MLGLRDSFLVRDEAVSAVTLESHLLHLVTTQKAHENVHALLGLLLL